MNTENKISTKFDISLGKAALIAGLGLLLMVLTAPVAELYLLPKLVDYADSETTLVNISTNKGMLVAAIFLYLVTFIADVIVAWALYIFFIPVGRFRSLLTAWFRIVYTLLALFGLFNLSKVLVLLNRHELYSTGDVGPLAENTMFYFLSFGKEWGLAFIFFGIYLAALGILAYQATYVPRIMGILLIIAGLGYLISSLQPYFFPGVDTSFLMITYFGELVFMIWLLIKGRRVKLDSIR